MKILITDIDEVLLDWSKSFDQFARDNYGYTGVYIADSTKRLWDIVSVEKENIGKVMAEHTQLQRFGELEYHKDAKVLLEYKNMFDKIIAITSCGKAPHIMDARNRNIKNKFPKTVDEVIYLDFLQKKIDVIKDLVNTYPDAEFYMIDDSVDDIEKAIEVGVKGFVYRAAFHDPKDLPVVDTLTEFFQKIVK